VFAEASRIIQTRTIEDIKKFIEQQEMEKYVTADESQRLVNLEKIDLGSRYKLLTYMFFLILAIFIPFILTDAYVRHLLVFTLIFSTLALSLDIILGHMGQFSFGHQGFFGLGGYVTGILTTKLGFSAWAGFFAGIASAAFLGLLVGLVALRRARGFFLGIITLGVGKILWLISIRWSEVTGGALGVPSIPRLGLHVPFLGGITFDSEFSFYYLALALLMFTIYIIYVWKGSRFGRAVSAVRENEQLANSIGVSPYKCYVWSFTFACALAGLAGVMYAHYMAIIVPPTLSMEYMFWMLVMVIVGGMRTFAGPIIGAAIFVFVPEWLVALEEFRMVIVGGIVLSSILFMRKGVVPSLSALLKNLDIKGRLLGNFKKSF
jgi:branched-chain amino acid transport system permease protein